MKSFMPSHLRRIELDSTLEAKLFIRIWTISLLEPERDKCELARTKT
jgi:hypothetical protein